MIKALNDTCKSMYGTLEIEVSSDSTLNFGNKFNIDYSLDFDDFPSDELCIEVENCDSLEEILYLVEKVDCTLLSFNSFSLGQIFDSNSDTYHTLEFKIDFFTDMNSNKDIQDMGIDYQDTFEELFELIHKMI